MFYKPLLVESSSIPLGLSVSASWGFSLKDTGMEEWRKVEGFDNYEVSSLGRVRSWANFGWGRSNQAKLIKIAINKKRYNYCYVSLWKNNKCHTKLLHRVVLEAFVGPCPEGMEGCHYDGNNQNNSIINLRWDTAKNNTRDKFRHKTILTGEDHNNSKYKEDDVIYIRCCHHLHNMTFAEIGREMGMCQYYVRLIALGLRWQYV